MTSLVSNLENKLIKHLKLENSFSNRNRVKDKEFYIVVVIIQNQLDLNQQKISNKQLNQTCPR